MFQNAKQQTRSTCEFKHDISQISESGADITAISDSKLFNLCKQFGGNALKWRWRFAGLLPEVNRRLLYEKKGYSCIFEFAARLAGMSREQVHLVLNLERRFEDKPALKHLLVSGESSINKLARIASIATKDNAGDLAENVRKLSSHALEVFVRDEKNALGEHGDLINQNFTEVNLEGETAGKIHNQKGLEKPENNSKSLHVQTLQEQLILDEENVKELFDLQKMGVNINELIQKMLNNRKTEIAIAKEQIAAKMEQEGSSVAGNKQTVGNFGGHSRYIPVEIRKIIKQEYGTKCAVPTCKNPASTIHHTHRFAIAKNHNPYYLAPLCRGHHEIAHSIDLKYGSERAGAGERAAELE